MIKLEKTKIQVESNLHAQILMTIISQDVYKDINVQKKLNIRITNNTKEGILFGQEFNIQYLDTKGWKEIENSVFLNEIGYKLLPQESSIISLFFNEEIKLKSGKYKIIKKFTTTDGKQFKKSIIIHF